MKVSPFSCLVLTLVAASVAEADTRTSASYGLTTEATNPGAGRISSADYSGEVAATGCFGLSAGTGTLGSGSSGSVTIAQRAGYVGQIYDIVGLNLSAAPSTVAEGSSRQIEARHLLDDSTLLIVNPDAVTWSVSSGPLTSVSSSGLVLAGSVYEATSAVVQGVLAGRTNTITLSVTDANPDNFGSYAGDGLPDGWQAQYFGLDNPLAAPAVDADGSGLTNLFKYTAGLDPLDPNSVFHLRIEAVSGEPDRKKLTFSPRFDDRTYTPVTAADLTSLDWTVLSGGTTSDNGNERSVVDPAALGSKFYRILITKP